MSTKKSAIKATYDRPMSERSCFILMPFKDPFNSYYEQIIKPAVLKTEMKCLRADEIYSVSPIMHDVLSRIQQADVIIAELTTRNPNVLYELGIAHAIDKPVIILSQTMDDVPSDLRHWRILLYDTIQANWAKLLAKRIIKTLNQIEVQDQFLNEPNRNISRLEFQLDQTREQLLMKLPITNPFVDRLAAWRFERATSVANEIISNRVPFTAMDYSKYIGYIFSAIMRQMEPHESYYTISNIEFWSENGVKDSNFLIENILAAERGVQVNRIILVAKEELKKIHSLEQTTIAKVLRKHFEKVMKNIQTRRNMVTHILPVDKLNEAIVKYSHFGLLIDTQDNEAENGNALLVSPNLKSRTLLQGINLLFSSGPCKNQYEFLNALRNFREIINHPDIVNLIDLFRKEDENEALSLD